MDRRRWTCMVLVKPGPYKILGVTLYSHLYTYNSIHTRQHLLGVTALLGLSWVQWCWFLITIFICPGESYPKPLLDIIISTFLFCVEPKKQRIVSCHDDLIWWNMQLWMQNRTVLCDHSCSALFFSLSISFLSFLTSCYICLFVAEVLQRSREQ